MCIEDKVQKAVIAKIRAVWKRFKNVAGTVCKKGLSMKLRGLVYKMYIRSAMSYWAKCWPVKGKQYKENGVHSNENALNDMWQDTER